MELKFEVRHDHLQVTALGSFDLSQAKQGLAQLVQRSEAAGLRKILVDARGIDSMISIADRYDLATSLANLAGGRLRVALVVSPANMFTKTFEDTATNRGAAVRTTDSMNEAREFLDVTGA